VSIVPQPPQSISSTLNSSSLDLASAVDLTQWADRADSKTAFPELMRRLLAQTPGITNIEMRAHEGTTAPGWDGRATSVGSAYLPAGELRLELGTDKKVKSKADSDYVKRAKKLGAEARRYIYVFATPRDWTFGQKWADDRRKEQKFADVKVIDAHTLDGWLQATPAVHYWLSERLGRQPRDVSTLSAWWERFQSGLRTDIPSQFFLARRDKQMRKILSELQADKPTKPVSVASTCAEDVLSFVYAALIDQPEVVDRSVVVDSRSAWSHLIETTVPLLLIPRFDDPDISGALKQGHRVLVTVDGGKEYSHDDATISLPKIGRQEAAKALREADVDFRRAERLAALARRSMASFIRSISHNPAKQKPAWLSDAGASAILAPLVLVGAWEDNCAHDEIYVQSFVGKPMKDIRHLLISLSQQVDAPFVRSGSAWRLVDPVDAARLLLPKLDREIVQRWEGFARDVLLAKDPYHGMNASEQLMVQAQGVEPGRSDMLRDHVAEGLALAAVSSDKFTLTVRSIVQRLLDEVFTDSTGEMLANLAPVFPLLAEAAPDNFLVAVAEDLDKPEPIIRTLFQESSNSIFGSSPLHPYLLWALEHLCWSSDYYDRAAMMLAGLADIDPGSQLSNRPVESLEKVTVGWTVQSAANIDDKTAVVEETMRRYPDVGWRLALVLLQPRHSLIISSNGPRYRNWELPGDSVTYDAWDQFVEKILLLVIKTSGVDACRWIQTVELIRHLPPDTRRKLIQSLREVVQSSASKWSDEDRFVVWNALTTEVDYHEAYADTAWAATSAELETLREVAQTLDRQDEPRRYARLFGWETDLVLEGLRWNDDGFQEKLNNARFAAIKKVAKAGIDAICILTENVKRPDLVGVYLAKTQSLEDINVLSWLDDTSEQLQRVAAAYVWNRLDDNGFNWLKKMLDTAGLSMAGREKLVGAVPMKKEYWTQVSSLDEHLIAAYWGKADHRGVTDEDIAEAIELIVQHGRPWQALEMLSRLIHGDSGYDVALVKKVLYCLVATVEPSCNAQHYSYEVSEALKWLESTMPNDPDLPRLEFQFFDFVYHHDPSNALYRALGDSPSYFVHLVKAKYRIQEDARTTTKEEQGAYAQRAWSVLQNWSCVPGLRDDGTIDVKHLSGWVKESREQLAGCGRAEVGDNEIGNALSCCPAGKDGIWPSEEVRGLFEALKNSDIEKGFARGRYNQRGVSVRGVHDGGEQEHTMAQQYRTDAKRLGLRWPRTARVLRGLADEYEFDAQYIDQVDERHADEG